MCARIFSNNFSTILRIFSNDFWAFQRIFGNESADLLRFHRPSQSALQGISAERTDSACRGPALSRCPCGGLASQDNPPPAGGRRPGAVLYASLTEARVRRAAYKTTRCAVRTGLSCLAERTRFELVIRLPVCRFSKPVDSATLPPLQGLRPKVFVKPF